MWGKDSGISVQTTSLITTTGDATAIATRQILRYAGYAYDAESGLYYCSARSYDPATRQWISKDPEKADGGESAYQYCGGNPVDVRDIVGSSAENLHAKKAILFNWNAPNTTYYLRTVLATNRSWSVEKGFSEWFRSVNGGGKWDFKLVPGGASKKYFSSPMGYHTVTVILNLHKYTETFGFNDYLNTEDFGNMNFGYTGRAMGQSWQNMCRASSLKCHKTMKTRADERNEARDEAMICWGYMLGGYWFPRPHYGEYYTRALACP